MGTEVTVLLDSMPLFEIDELIGRFKKYFKDVKYIRADSIITMVCHSPVRPCDVQPFCEGVEKYIDTIICSPCDEEHSQQMAEEYGFVTADKL